MRLPSGEGKQAVRMNRATPMDLMVQTPRLGSGKVREGPPHAIVEHEPERSLLIAIAQEHHLRPNQGSSRKGSDSKNCPGLGSTSAGGIQSMPQFPTFGPMTMRSIHLFLLGLTTACTLTLCAQDHPLGDAHLGRGDCRIRSAPPGPSGRHSVRGIRASDVGRPLHLFNMGPADAPLRILVNNAIHPVSPAGSTPP